jgi:hypothetical protein
MLELEPYKYLGQWYNTRNGCKIWANVALKHQTDGLRASEKDTVFKKYA